MSEAESSSLRLSTEQIIALHSRLLKETGGLDGIRDENLLDSAVNAPFQSFGGFEAHPSIMQKAARLCLGIAKNHAFIDGNKRTAAHAMLIFLSLNGIELEYEQESLAQIVLKVVANEADESDLLNWLEDHKI